MGSKRTGNSLVTGRVSTENHVGAKQSTLDLRALTEAQKGYIAAFLDGEGGIQITQSFRKDREYRLALHPDVYFTTTNEEVIRTI